MNSYYMGKKYKVKSYAKVNYALPMIFKTTVLQS